MYVNCIARYLGVVDTLPCTPRVLIYPLMESALTAAKPRMSSTNFDKKIYNQHLHGEPWKQKVRWYYQYACPDIVVFWLIHDKFFFKGIFTLAIRGHIRWWGYKPTIVVPTPCSWLGSVVVVPWCWRSVSCVVWGHSARQSTKIMCACILYFNCLPIKSMKVWSGSRVIVQHRRLVDSVAAREYSQNRLFVTDTCASTSFRSCNIITSEVMRSPQLSNQTRN